jgi:flagellar hook-associated protein 3 FlgL
MVDRIASFTQTSSILTNNLRLQSNYAKTQTQVASGMIADRYEGIAGGASRLLNLESDYDRITQQTENSQLVADRADIMYDALGSMVSQTQQFAADLSSTISGFGLQGADLANNAQTKLNQVAGNLNTQLADRYLFAGAATQTAPVDLNDPAFGGQLFVLPGPSVTDFDYYQGDSYVQRVEASDGFFVEYGVQADNPAFEKIIRAYDLILTNPTDQDTIEEAYRVMQEGIDDVAVLQASISQDAQTLDKQINANLEDLLLLETQIASIREVDLAEATTRLKQLETQLEASYSVTASMLKLNLADYVR